MRRLSSALAIFCSLAGVVLTTSAYADGGLVMADPHWMPVSTTKGCQLYYLWWSYHRPNVNERSPAEIKKWDTFSWDGPCVRGKVINGQGKLTVVTGIGRQHPGRKYWVDITDTFTGTMVGGVFEGDVVETHSNMTLPQDDGTILPYTRTFPYEGGCQTPLGLCVPHRGVPSDFATKGAAHP